MSAITTHVLDLMGGRPAAGVRVVLERQAAKDNWKLLARGVTNEEGRITDFLPKGAPVEAGSYRLTFETGAYFKALDIETFYPHAAVVFEVQGIREHYHVPLLLSPFGYSTYRGS